MNITVYEPRAVTLTDAQVLEASIEQIKALLDGDCVEVINGEKILTRWYDTGHGSGMTDKIRPATELDEALLTVYNHLQQLKYRATHR